MTSVWPEPRSTGWAAQEFGPPALLTGAAVQLVRVEPGRAGPGRGSEGGAWASPSRPQSSQGLPAPRPQPCPHVLLTRAVRGQLPCGLLPALWGADPVGPVLGSPPELEEPPLPLPQDRPASPPLAPCLPGRVPSGTLPEVGTTFFLGDSAFPQVDFPEFLILGSHVCLVAACAGRTARWLQVRVGCAPQLPRLSTRRCGCLDVGSQGPESGPPAVCRDRAAACLVVWRAKPWRVGGVTGWGTLTHASQTQGQGSRPRCRGAGRNPLQLPLYLLEVIK